ncbi:ribosomal protein L11 methyltransferase [Arenicella chitinivorans]|uniref:Ribosomal protein L11 methyltransferase n=1 Tax=Arenicella chitinivorans TaxID=1329800 RepID=A0A918S0K9_9GAMM|nr:50S ribosomal protein L11 methyltransferase [Arenicella chitinivorans]GHA18332.1 ribosomal protein L11 methyltransferase [Arenicella chitinivorans]
MRWTQARFVVDANQVDRLSATLEAFLAQAVTTENAGADEYYEVAFPGQPTWQKVRVTALFDAQIALEPIIDFVQQHFSAQSNTEIPVQVETLVDQDWERVWLDSFTPIEVGDRLWICPSWCDPVDPEARNIILDPGLAFGTGTHPTTHLCLQWLSRQDLSGQAVLDYGSGTGILAIAALLSGAESAEAVDIDPLAVTACDENAARNELGHNLHACLPNQLADEPRHRYPLVIANILADVIIQLKDTLLAHLHAEGTLLLTGILTTQVDRVTAAFGDKMAYHVEHQEQWALIIATPKA